MLADNALTTLDRMKLMLGLSDIEDERTDEIVTVSYTHLTLPTN